MPQRIIAINPNPVGIYCNKSLFFEMKNDNRRNFKLIAKTLQSFEELLAKELHEIGARNIRIRKRAVEFEGDLEILYKANLYTRTAVRILKPIHHFYARSEEEFYHRIKEMDWDEYLTVNKTFAINAVVNSQTFTHSQYMALKAKDAIADRFREKEGTRPSVDVENPSLRINIHISDNDCNVLLDSSNVSLHKRGYRERSHLAPLNEVLAAGMIMLTGWDGQKDLVDPMCGSATILIEGALIATNTPPGLNRSFGFQKWPDFDKQLWEDIRERAKAETHPIDINIMGSDIDGRVLDVARNNITEAGMDEWIRVAKKPFDESVPKQANGCLITNPPYDERLKIEDVEAFYKSLGDHLKQHYQGFEAWILSSNKSALKRFGLKTSKRLTLYNGPLECKYHQYELYAGSKKAKYKE